MEIVLVDDSNLTNIINKSLIKRHSQSIAVKVFEDSEEALYYVSNSTEPKLIFLDLNMPKLNGWQFLELVEKNKLEHLKIIILTSSVDIKDKEKAQLDKLVTNYINKPLTKEDFKEFYQKYFSL